MRKKALHKDFRVEIRKSKNRFLSIFFIVALGVAFFSGIQSSAPDMRLTGDSYFDDSRLMDLRVISTLGLTEDDLDALEEIEGVSFVAGSYMEDVYCGEGDAREVLHVEALQDGINELTPAEGRLPERADECFLDAAYALKTGYRPGDELEIAVSSEEDSSLRHRKFTVSGYGYSPCYLSFNRGSTALGTGSLAGFAYVIPEEFDAEIYSVAYLRVDGAAAKTAFTDGYDDLVDEVCGRIEGIADARCEIRYNEVTETAESELAEAKQEVADGKQELADAKQELKDGRAEAESELAEAESELTEGEQELEDGKRELWDAREEFADGERELKDGEKEIEENESTLEEGRSQMEEARGTLDSGEKEYSTGVKEYESESAKGEKELKAAQKQIDAGKKQLAAGQKAYKENLATYNAGQKQLAAAETQLTQQQAAYDSGMQQLTAGKAQYETGLEQYNAGLAAYNAAAAQLQGQLQEYDNTIAALQAAVDAAQQAQQECDARVAQNRSDRDEMSGQLAQAQKALEGLNQQLQDAREAQKGVPALQAQRDAQAGTLTDQRNQLATAEAATADLQAQQQTAEADLQAAQDALEKLQKAPAYKDPGNPDSGYTEDYQNALSAAQQAVEDRQAAADTLAGQAGAQESVIADLKTKIADQEAKVSGLDAQIQALNAAVGTAESNVSGKNSEIEALRQEIAALDAEYSGTASQGKLNLVQEQQQKQQAAAKAVATRDSTVAGLAGAKAKMDEAQTTLAGQKQTLDATATALAASKQELDANEQELNAAGQQLTAAWQQLNTQKTQAAAAGKQLAAAKKELDANEKKLKQGQEEINQGYQELKKARAQLTSARRQLDSGWAQLEASQSQASEGERQLAEGRQKLSDARSDLAEARRQIRDGQREIVENEHKIQDGWEDYEEGKKEAEDEIAEGEQKIKDAEADLAEAEEQIADAEEKLADLRYPDWYIDNRSALPEHAGFGENAERLSNIAKVVPILFFLVAALISLTTMTRMVEEERTQIGTLKALGYGKWSIASKYLKYAFLATLGGGVAGILIGEKIFPWVIINAYGIMYQHIPEILLPYNWTYGLIAMGAALLCTIGATVSACYKELMAVPAQLMRPPAPKEGKRVFLERITFLWKRLSFTWKSTVRNLFRYKKRFLMTVIGIGGCMGLLLVGYGLLDSITDIGTIQFDELQLYDAVVVLDTDADASEIEEVEDALRADERVTHSKRFYMQLTDVQTEGITDKEWSVYLYVPEDLEDLDGFFRFRDRETKEPYELGDEGAIITEKIAKEFKLKPGDVITLEQDEGDDVEVPIAAVCENYLSHYLYMTPALYEKVYGEAPEFNSVFFESGEPQEGIEEIGETMLSHDAVLNVTYTGTLAQQIENMLGAMDVVMLVLIVSAGALAVVVLYNLNNININERRRELATLKVLGFYNGEVAAYVYRENILLTLIGAALGIGLGKLLHAYIITTIEVDACMFGRNINLPSFVYGTLFTIGFSVIVNGVMYFKLKKIDMVESLKSVE